MKKFATTLATMCILSVSGTASATTHRLFTGTSVAAKKQVHVRNYSTKSGRLVQQHLSFFFGVASDQKN